MKKDSWIRGVLLLLFALLMVAAIYIGYDYYKLSRVNTETLMETAIDNLKNRSSYRFSVNSKLKLNNYTTAETTIAGERNNKKDLHVWGKIMDTDMEIYQIGNHCYRYNSGTDHWVELTNHPLTDQPLVLMEILPETNFSFAAVTDKKYIKKDIAKGKIYHIYTFKITDENHFANEYYEGFTYKVYIEAKTKEITKAVLKATSRVNSKNTLMTVINFTDINAEIPLHPPI